MLNRVQITGDMFLEDKFSSYSEEERKDFIKKQIKRIEDDCWCPVKYVDEEGNEYAEIVHCSC